MKSTKKTSTSLKLKKLFTALSMLSITTIVSAGAMGPVTAPINWNGPYAGVDVGGAWMSADFLSDVFLPGSGFPNGASAEIPRASVWSANTSSWAGGVHIGYNYQPSWKNWASINASPVFGVAADFIFADSELARDTITNPNLALPAGTLHESINMNWQGNVRLNAGIAFNKLYVYGTGGVMMAKIETASQVCFPGLLCNLSSSSTTSSGGVFGFGADYRPSPKWSVGALALWANPDKDTNLSNSITPAGAIIPDAILAHRVDKNTVFVTARLTYYIDTMPGDIE